MLDLFLDNAAAGMGKRVQAMETPRDHCRPLNRLTTKQVRERERRGGGEELGSLVPSRFYLAAVEENRVSPQL